jgi:sugar phosphate isomerase/epimerase
MFLGINTYLFEVAGVPVTEALGRVAKAGFHYVEYAAYKSGDVTVMDKSERKKIIDIFKDNDLECSQFQLAYVQDMAGPDEKARDRSVDYMKRCAEFLMELGGRLMLVWYGGGSVDFDISREQSWLNSVDSLRRFAEWCLPHKLLIDLELEPTTYSILNSVDRMAKMIEDVGLPNINSNIDIGHFYLNRMGPKAIEKLRQRMLHVHISETEGYEHTNDIIGSGAVPFKDYVDEVIALGIEDNCRAAGVPCVAGIEMGSPVIPVDDPMRWVNESLEYLKGVLPELTLRPSA